MFLKMDSGLIPGTVSNVPAAVLLKHRFA